MQRAYLIQQKQDAFSVKGGVFGSPALKELEIDPELVASFYILQSSFMNVQDKRKFIRACRHCAKKYMKFHQNQS